MSKKSWMRYIAGPMLIAGLAAPTVMTGCTTDDVCDAELVTRLNELSAAVDDLITVSRQMRKDVTVACVNIATDLGTTEMLPAVDASTAVEDITDEDLNVACTIANDEVNAALQAGVTINIGIEGGYCEINAEAQLSCEAECSVDGQCDPGSLEVRCDPGELSVVCEGSCEVGATCQAEANAVANCEGSCSGLCNGMCDGQATTGSAGSTCAGTCEGTCSGECVLDANVEVECGATARCKGGCTTNYTEPRCEGELTPPSCDVDVDCQAGCEGQAKFEATCVEPSIVVEVTAGDNAALVSTLETNLPALVSVALDQGPLLVEAAVDTAAAFGRAADAVGGTALCQVLATASITANVSISVEASATVSTCASASANASGTAGVEDANGGA